MSKRLKAIKTQLLVASKPLMFQTEKRMELLTVVLTPMPMLIYCKIKSSKLTPMPTNAIAPGQSFSHAVARAIGTMVRYGKREPCKWKLGRE
jgi:hypothetical protein